MCETVMDDGQLIQVFREEAEELCNRIESGLLRLEENPGNSELVYEVFRAFHSLKGSAGVVGFAVLSRFAHAAESALQQVQEGKREVNAALISLLLRANDKLRELLAAALRGQPEAVSGLAEIEAELGGSKMRKPVPAAGETEREPQDRLFKIVLRFQPALFESGQDPLLLLWELAELGEFVQFQVKDEDLPKLEAMDPFRLYLSWELVLWTSATRKQVEEVLIFVKDIHPVRLEEMEPTPLAGRKQPESRDVSQAERVPAAPGGAQSFPREEMSSIRIATEKVDQLMNLAEEVALHFSHVAQKFGLTGAGQDAEFSAAVAQVFQDIQALQEQVMRIRMLPVRGLFQRFARMIRDLALQQGKHAALKLEGGETELDKDVLQQLSDPLKHLVRNAVDHGLEPPEERRAAGKPPEGTLVLAAYQRNGRVYLEVRDDGRGIDLEKVRKKAVELGWLDGEERPDNRQLIHFLLAPGFSTADRISEVSGRGIGLDVVAQAIRRLRGSLAVETLPGRGTTVRLSIPLTLAIVDALVVGISDQIWIIPAHHVLQTLAGGPAGVHSVRRADLLRYRDGFIPAFQLRDFFPGSADALRPASKLLLILEGAAGPFALWVDEILSEQKIVLKSLEQNYRPLPGTAGASILENGRVGLVLDPVALSLLHRKKSAAFGGAGSQPNIDRETEP